MGEAYKVFLQMRETGYLVTKKKKNSCPTYHPFNVFFGITTYNFLTTGGKLQQVPSIFACIEFIITYYITERNLFGNTSEEHFFRIC